MKQQTRGKRGGGTTIQYHIHPDVSVTKNWKQFLTVGQNKAYLVEYYITYLVERAEALLAEHQTLHIGDGQGDKAVRITKHGCSERVDLQSNHEEADTRMYLHVRDAAENGANYFVISSPDTDVLVLLLHQRSDISASKLFFFPGKGGKIRQSQSLYSHLPDT